VRRSGGHRACPVLPRLPRLPAALLARGGGPPQTPPRLIPLLPGVARGTGDRRALLRTAVLQVVSHLVERAVPPAQRVPLFDQAKDLLDEAGWGLGELAGALEPGPAQDALLSALGLLER